MKREWQRIMRRSDRRKTDDKESIYIYNLRSRGWTCVCNRYVHVPYTGVGILYPRRCGDISWGCDIVRAAYLPD